MSNTAVQSGHTIATLLQQSEVPLTSVLPKGMNDPEGFARFARIILINVKANPDLQRVPPDTVINATLLAATMGLTPGVGGEGFLIPRMNKRTKRKECMFQPGYRGLMKLAWNTSIISKLKAEKVCENDPFDYQRGTDSYIKHRDADGDRGKLTHVYALAEMVNGGKEFEVMSLAEIKEHRDKFKSTRSGGVWESDFTAMAKKTVMLALLNWLPTSNETKMAVSTTELLNAGVPQDPAAYLPQGFQAAPQALPEASGPLPVPLPMIEAKVDEPDDWPEPDDWDALMDGDELSKAVDKILPTKAQHEKLHNLHEMEDWEGIRTLAREATDG